MSMAYECGEHSYTMCIKCARLHRICPKDFTVLTLESVTDLAEKKQKIENLDAIVAHED